ncbi:MAG: tRNA (N6-isopentenyl adenosine(37)-C2)-methylthiotransferase MiaB [Candidatus Parcubacteria bacterium]|nr:tRNA (N6-isopentenyl adenosine(37)-C2)-methylthiotransferase MiaB [Candidatus Parcubacteria bacterium]
MKYYIKIFGCQMNYSDAERAAAKLEELGYKQALDDKDADLILLVTCSVRKSAEDRVYGAINNYHKKKLYPKLKTIILSGCMANRPEVVKKADKADIFLDIKDLNKLPEFLKKESKAGYVETYFSVKPRYQSSFTAYVPIMTGCNNFCSYCIVPYVRGREESRSSEEIIAEVKDLIAQGFKEIILLGQNVNSYKPATAAAIKDFPDLLEYLAKLPGNFWLSFITSHPKDLSDKLIKVIARNKSAGGGSAFGGKICEYISLPVQSGDNEILKKMNRKYTISQYKKLVKKIRKQIPGVAISTDVIVGFPGETEKRFLNTVKLFQKVKFDMAYINQYSPREGTASAKLKDDVPKIEKKKRDKELNDVLIQTALEINKKLIGQVLDALVYQKSKGDIWLGKTRTFKVVKFKSKKNLLGKFVKVKINKAESFGLIGKSIDSSKKL